MLYTTILLYGIIEYFLLKKFKITFNNFTLTTFLKSIIIIPIYLIIYLPIYYNFGENMLVTFIILFITILFVNYLASKLLNLHHINYQKEVSIIFIIIVYVIMGYLTFKAQRKELFFDTQEEKYGINDYLIKE